MATEHTSDPEDAAGGSRAIVPVAPALADRGPVRQRLRNDPSFITQLIATACNVPQTRARSRAEPLDATLAYGVAAEGGAQATCRTRRIV
jgi:hypothetical protein